MKLSSNWKSISPRFVTTFSTGFDDGMSVAVRCVGSDVVAVNVGEAPLLLLNPTRTGELIAIVDGGAVTERPFGLETEMLTGPSVTLLPTVSLTVNENCCEVFSWPATGVHENVFVPEANVMPLGIVPGVTVAVSPEGSTSVCTVYV